MGFIEINGKIFGDPLESSHNAIERETYTIITCQLCNKPADELSLQGSRLICDSCHAVN